MPLYEYSCLACAERFELLQTMGAGAEAVRCPACGAGQVERRLSTFSAAVGGSPKSAAADAGCSRPDCCSGLGCAN